jgi:uncharacterized protein
MDYPLLYKDYQEALEQGKFLGLRCQNCGVYTFPPKAVCEACGSQGLEIAEITGNGLIRSFTVIRVAPDYFTPPYIVALVELEQGPWVLGNLISMSPDEATMDLIGKPVVMASASVAKDVYAGGDCRVLTFELA